MQIHQQHWKFWTGTTFVFADTLPLIVLSSVNWQIPSTAKNSLAGRLKVQCKTHLAWVLTRKQQRCWDQPLTETLIVSTDWWKYLRSLISDSSLHWRWAYVCFTFRVLPVNITVIVCLFSCRSNKYVCLSCVILIRIFVTIVCVCLCLCVFLFCVGQQLYAHFLSVFVRKLWT